MISEEQFEECSMVLTTLGFGQGLTLGAHDSLHEENLGVFYIVKLRGCLVNLVDPTMNYPRSARWFLLGAKLTQLPIVEMLDEIWININLRVTISSSLTADSNPKTAVLSLHRSLMLRLRVIL
ncbi:hypothetical protein CDL15_Pgr004222 [Punica granatum]|uniref:Uncharacterized protein n=1 Tax=Punica granatum TaxID=22663 RepID=A0A218XH47_PUNGR|nr:hypothetical protein CDL15_Pgr004222 [Punica granatum]